VDIPNPVLTDRDGAIVTLSLNNPERLNAVSEELYQRLEHELAAVAVDGAVRAVVLRGSGRAFCAGADLKRHADTPRTATERREYVWLGQRVCQRLQQLRQPVIAGVHGYALGAGAELALSCDFVVMAEDARMGFPEVSIGTYVGGGVTKRLPALVGLARAKELLLLGERFTGRQAHAWGLVHEAVAEDELWTRVERLAAHLAAKAPLPAARAKRDLERWSTRSAADALAAEADGLLACMESSDWTEGVAAFREKRTPTFIGA
jgi:enoyl-CoA hydratase